MLLARWVRGNGPYLISQVWRDGRPHQLHLGRASPAELQAIAAAKAERDLARDQRRREDERSAALDRQSAELAESVQIEAQQFMAEHKFHDPKSRGWRRKRNFRRSASDPGVSG